ncbi:acyltransferase family protein [Methyloligella halotolerans]|uniref:acyltransferase family protein n=1 Tax=Methyloligella halotolerans TaxID=1177755 RepID=UPI00083E16B3|nr:acyltransferase [Methyloligella halotolerans]
MSSATVAERMSGRDNNFNLIRFLAATVVMLDHAVALAGTGDPRVLTLGPFSFDLHAVPLGRIAVDVFFVVSGFLVTRSVLTRPTVLDFTVARVLRLFPALLAVCLLTAFVLGPLISDRSLSEYFGDLKTWLYAPLTGLLVSHSETLPGVFGTVREEGVVNSPLWTLRYEAVCYAILGGLALVGALLDRRIVYTLAALLAAYLLVTFGTDLRGQMAAIDSLARFGLSFFLGGAIYVFADRIRLNLLWLVGLAVVAAATSQTSIAEFTFRLALAYGVVWVALVPGGPIRSFNRLGDYSYGLYILCWPIQQTIVTLMPGIAAPALFVLSFPVTLGIAALSWHLVEHPALERKEATSRRAASLATSVRGRLDGWRGGRRKPGLDPQESKGS